MVSYCWKIAFIPFCWPWVGFYHRKHQCRQGKVEMRSWQGAVVVSAPYWNFCTYCCSWKQKMIQEVKWNLSFKRQSSRNCSKFMLLIILEWCRFLQYFYNRALIFSTTFVEYSHIIKATHSLWCLQESHMFLVLQNVFLTISTGNDDCC